VEKSLNFSQIFLICYLYYFFIIDLIVSLKTLISTLIIALTSMRFFRRHLLHIMSHTASAKTTHRRGHILNLVLLSYVSVAALEVSLLNPSDHYFARSERVTKIIRGKQRKRQLLEGRSYTYQSVRNKAHDNLTQYLVPEKGVVG